MIILKLLLKVRVCFRNKHAYITIYRWNRRGDRIPRMYEGDLHLRSEDRPGWTVGQPAEWSASGNLWLTGQVSIGPVCSFLWATYRNCKFFLNM